MQSLGQRYVGFVNSEHSRSGTLWEGRYKSGLVDSDRYLLTCYRYIELNPVRAGLAAAPGDYRWSSFAHNAYGTQDSLITPHEIYSALGCSDAERRSAYLRLFPPSIPAEEINAIRNHVNQGKALGTPNFQQEIGSLLGRRVKLSKLGRPKNAL